MTEEYKLRKCAEALMNGMCDALTNHAEDNLPKLYPTDPTAIRDFLKIYYLRDIARALRESNRHLDEIQRITGDF